MTVQITDGPKTSEQSKQVFQNSFTIRAIRTITTGKRNWAIEPEWLGWYRLIALGIVVNVKDCSLTIWFCGWQIHVGRLLVRDVEIIHGPAQVDIQASPKVNS